MGLLSGHELVEIEEDPSDADPLRRRGRPRDSAPGPPGPLGPQKVLERATFAVRGSTPQAQQERMVDPLAIARRRRAVGQDPGRQPAGDLDERRVIEQGQRLERRVGTHAAGAGLHAAGSVESGEEGKWAQLTQPPQDAVARFYFCPEGTSRK